MWLLGIIPDEVTHELPVEVVDFTELVCMPVSELLLKGSIESLQVTVRLGMMRVIEEVGEGTVSAVEFKVFGKFSAVVGLDSLYGEGGDTDELTEKVPTTDRKVGLISVGESESGADVDGSENVALETSGELPTQSVRVYHPYAKTESRIYFALRRFVQLDERAVG